MEWRGMMGAEAVVYQMGFSVPLKTPTTHNEDHLSALNIDITNQSKIKPKGRFADDIAKVDEDPCFPLI